MSGAGMPIPRSRIEKCRLSPASASSVSDNRRSVAGVSRMASQPLRIRFSSTCCSCTRSASTGGSVGRNRRRCRHAPRDQLASSQLEDVVEELRRVHGLQPRVAAPEQRAKTTDDLRGPLVRRHDVVKNRVDLAEVDRLAFDEMPRRFGVARDGGERLVELVRKRARELSERGNAREVRQLAPLLVDLELGVMTRRHVRASDHGAALGPLERLDAQGKPARSLAVDVVVFHLETPDVALQHPHDAGERPLRGRVAVAALNRHAAA